MDIRQFVAPALRFQPTALVIPSARNGRDWSSVSGGTFYGVTGTITNVGGSCGMPAARITAANAATDYLSRNSSRDSIGSGGWAILVLAALEANTASFCFLLMRDTASNPNRSFQMRVDSGGNKLDFIGFDGVSNYSSVDTKGRNTRTWTMYGVTRSANSVAVGLYGDGALSTTGQTWGANQAGTQSTGIGQEPSGGVPNDDTAKRVGFYFLKNTGGLSPLSMKVISQRYMPKSRMRAKHRKKI